MIPEEEAHNRMRSFLKKHRGVRALLWIVLLAAALILGIFVFLRSDPVFGGRPTKADREDYARRAAGYFDGESFRYPDAWKLAGADEDRRVSRKETAPKDTLPVAVPDFALAGENDVVVTWFGHSSSLIQIHGKAILIDPVFSRRSSPVRWAGPARFTQPSVTVDELPEIDAVLITHDHYDHLDMETIQALEKKTARFLVPLGIDKHITRWIGDDSKVQNLAWWESVDLDGLEIICTPANHRSGRGLDNQQSTLFCSWVLRDGQHQILESSDTGYGAHFAEIHDRYGDFDLFMPDCGQYNIRWHDWHMFPEESAMAAQTLGAKAVLPIHWGAFVLSTHGWDDSPERITAACEEKGIAVLTPRLCESLSLEQGADFCDRWWRDYR